MAAEPTSRRYAHSEGTTHLCFDDKRQLVTCGHDCDVRLFSGIEEDDSSEFTVTTETVSAVAPYSLSGRSLVAVATDDHSVQAFTREGTPEGLLLRFTSPVTHLSVDHTHLRLAAASSDFTIRIVKLDDVTQVSCLRGHEAPVLCVKFAPRGSYLASTSCDGTIRVWDLDHDNACVKQLPGLHKSNDVSLAKSLAYLSWRPPNGKLFAVPVETEVRVYEVGSWNCVATLKDAHHKEPIHVVSWSGCGQRLASAGCDGMVCVWDYASRTVSERYRNESGIGITSLEWYPDTSGIESVQESGCGLYFADSEGYIGWFKGVWPVEGGGGEVKGDRDDVLAEDSLLMEGIPPDAIFGTDDVMEDDRLLDSNVVISNGASSGSHGNRQALSEDWEEDDDIVQSRKRRRLLDDSDGETENAVAVPDDIDSLVSSDLGHAPSRPLAPPTKQGPVFSERSVEVYQPPLLPSSTPHTLSHHFLTYNMVGVVRSHTDDSAAMIEVEFHNSSVHHSFSIPNHHDNSMAALSEAALVLACQRSEDSPSQLQCVHFSSWDSVKDWSLPLPSKESITSLSLGNGWIAVATNKQLLRVFSLGGVQCDVISVAGVIVGVAGWGARLAIIYQEAPCTENVFQLKVWVLDVKKRKQLVSPHSLPLSLHSKLEWFGYSEGGNLLTYDTKGIVRLLNSAHYGGLSWIPILDTTKQVGNRSDHYFLVGMTHNPDEIRAVLCKGLKFPPVHPKPVMSVLPIKLPLCEPTSERTQLEDRYLQAALLSRDGVAKAQGLMKMFALACKLDHNYRAWEIAGMMEDEMTLNLALTYASRTQHLSLARHVSDLMQQKAVEKQENSDDSESESENEDIAYMERRTNALKQRVQLGNGAVSGTSGSKQAVHSLKIKGPKKTSKFHRNMKEIKQGRFLNNAHPTTSNGGQQRGGEGEMGEENSASNETRELFSGSEGVGSEGEEAGEGEEEGEGSEGGGSEGERSPRCTPVQLSTVAAASKRANPFKMTTPESRRVQTDRKSSFLDNIGERAELEERRREEQKKRKRGQLGRGERGERGGKGAKQVKSRKTGTTKKAAGVQSSLQTSLKLTASDKNPNSRPSPSEEGRERVEGERAGLPGEATGRETAQERLRGFAFSATSDSAT